METFEVFKLSKVKNADRIDNAFFKAKPSPLDSEYIDVVRDNLEW